MTERPELARPGEPEAALEAVFGAALVELPIPLLIYDVETQRILAVNDAACRQYGYPRREFLSMTLEDIISPEDVPAHRETARGEGARFRLWRDRRKDGTTIWVETASVEVPFRGRRARLVAAIDVTERERAVEELRTSEARMRALVGSIDEALFELDRTGTCLGIWTVNEALLVAPREQMLGRGIVELVGEERGRPLEEAVARVIDTGRAETLEHAVELADGTHWALARIAPIPGVDGRPMTASFLARDITGRVRAEEELRRTEERLRALIGQLPAMVFIERHEPDPTKMFYEYLSSQSEELYGYTAGELMARPELFEETLHPDDRERVIAANARAEEAGESFDEEYRVITRDGRVVWVQSRARLVRDAEGRPREWLGVELDITSRKEAEEALRLAEERYRTLVEQFPAVAFELVRGGGPSDMYFTYLSPQVEAIFGYPAEQLTRDPARFAQLVHPEDLERVVAAVGRASAEGGPFDADFRVLRPDGAVAWLHGRAAPVFDERGAVLSWQGVALDVTEQHEAAQALRQAEERYRRVVENTSDLITLVEPDGTIVFASPSHERILGLQPEDLVGRNVLDVLGPLNTSSARSALAVAAGGEQGPPVRVTMTHRDGRPVVLETSGGQPIFDEHGQVQLVLGVTRDVTERVRAEREREELLSTLVEAQEGERARIASDIHDDPIQAMVAVGLQLDLFAEHTGDPDLLARVERLRTSVRHAIERLRRLLFELSPPSLEFGLGPAILELATRAEEATGFELRIDDRTKEELPIEARTAAFRIVQEALANVRKHARARNVVVRLEERDGGTVVTVEDDGAGIGAGTTSEPGHLGLRGMQERAALMGGWLEFGPRPGGGTYVGFWLPGSSRR